MVNKITDTRILMQFVNDYNRRYYLREISSLLKKPHQTIKPHIEKLVKERILIREERKNLVEYHLNFNNKQLYDYLIIAEKGKTINKLKEEPLLMTLYDKISPFFKENCFILFGSSTEKIQKGSDIDLLIIGKGKIGEILDEFEDIYNKKVHKIQINNLKEMSDSFVKEIYKKHIIINNTERIINFFGELYEKNKLV